MTLFFASGDLQPPPVMAEIPREGSFISNQFYLKNGVQISCIIQINFFQTNISLKFISIHVLGGGFKYFLFSPRKLGKISNLTNIFQMGGSTTNQMSILVLSMFNFTGVFCLLASKPKQAAILEDGCLRSWCGYIFMAGQPTPPGHVPPPEIAGLMIRAY